MAVGHPDTFEGIILGSLSHPAQAGQVELPWIGASPIGKRKMSQFRLAILRAQGEQAELQFCHRRDSRAISLAGVEPRQAHDTGSLPAYAVA